MHLLLLGRHHLLTNHQLALLTLLTQSETPHGPIESLLWAIASANHAGTRRNPLPAHRREVAIEEFAAQLEPTSFVYHVDDVGHSERFADYVLKKIEVDSQGRFLLAPANAPSCTSRRGRVPLRTPGSSRIASRARCALRAASARRWSRSRGP